MSNRSNAMGRPTLFSALQLALGLALLSASVGTALAQTQTTWTITITLSGSLPYYSYSKAGGTCTYTAPSGGSGGPYNNPTLQVCTGDIVQWQYTASPPNGDSLTVIFSQKSHTNSPLSSGGWAIQGTQSPSAQGTTTSNPDNPPTYKYSLAVFDSSGNEIVNDDPQIKIGNGIPRPRPVHHHPRQ
jgi:hypothetical protein